MDFPHQVNVARAVQDGRKPEDFQFEQWSVRNVRMQTPRETRGARIPLFYRCMIPAGTPHANQYIEERQREPGVVYEDAGAPGWLKIPDPVGMALSWVKFELRAAEDYELLDDDSRDHERGEVSGFCTGRCRLWDRLTPGQTLRVQLTAQPFFYYLDENGGTRNDYAMANQGYFGGLQDKSMPYILSMNWDGDVALASG